MGEGLLGEKKKSGLNLHSCTIDRSVCMLDYNRIGKEEKSVG